MLNIVEMKTIEDVRQESETLSEEIEKLYNQNILPIFNEMKDSFFDTFEQFFKDHGFDTDRNKRIRLINVTYKKKTISASEVIDNDNEILICIDNEPHIDIILQIKNTKVYKPYQEPRTSFQKELVQLEKEMDEKKSLIKTYREPEIRYGIKENKEGLYFNSPNEILKHLFE